MDELKSDENCHAGNGFHEHEIQLRFQGIGRPDKHFGKNAHPSFTYVFSYFSSFSRASKMLNPHHIMDTKFIVDLFDRKENCILKECSKPLLYTIYGICYY